MATVPKESIASFRETLSRFVQVTTGSPMDEGALKQADITVLKEAVVAELKKTSLANQMELLESRKQLTLGVYVGAEFAYAQPIEHQVLVALASIFFFHADEVLEQKPEVLKNIQFNLATGNPLGDPVLEWYVRELMPRYWTIFPPLVASMLVVASYDFLNGIGIELLTQDDAVHPSAPGFPDWLRFKTGLSPMYALLMLVQLSDHTAPTGNFEKYVQAIPDIIIYTNITNDVISFYKEVLAGEKSSYIDLRAQRDNTDTAVALHAVAEEGIQARARALDLLKDAPEYYRNFETYARGIAHFHTSAPRYRMVELFEFGKK